VDDGSEPTTTTTISQEEEPTIGDHPPNNNSDHNNNAKCCMAFQHRNVCVSVLVDAFDKRGFRSYSPSGDYFQDIYGERGDERTMFNAMFLLVFERKTTTKNNGKEEAAATVVE
jgi:hypothetical protein